MPADYPDFGVHSANVAYPIMQDVGELAARMGSVVIYDRRGTVMDFDNFEEPILRWRTSSEGGNGYARLDSTYARSLAQCVRMHTPDENEDVMSMIRSIPTLYVGKTGVEISWCLLSTNCVFQLSMERYTGATSYLARLRVDPTAQELSILQSGGTYVTIADTGAIASYAFLYNTIKLVANLETFEYVRVLYNENEYDVSAYGLSEVGTTDPKMVEIKLRLVNTGANGGDVWIDGLIFTIDEP